MNSVALIDPTPIDSDIITTPAPAPANGFYSPVTYRGGFAPDENWLAGWSGADEFGFLFGTDDSDCGTCRSDADGNGKVGLGFSGGSCKLGMRRLIRTF